MIIGWKSPLDGRVYGLEDFEALNRVIPEPVLRAMTRKATMDDRHTGTNITITSGMSCPRKTLVTRMLDYTPDPTKMWKMHRGTWLHECVGLSLAENEAWITEEGDAGACTFSGNLFGIEMSCRIDARRRDWTEFLDWKFRSDGAERWVDPQGKAGDNDSAQMNMARMLMEQQEGVKLDNTAMHVWVMSGMTVRTTAPFMTEMQVGEMRPSSTKFQKCAYTIKDIFALLDGGMKAWRAAGSGESDSATIEQRQDIIASLPMVGETMWCGKVPKSMNCCTRYCEVQDQCYACSGGI